MIRVLVGMRRRIYLEAVADVLTAERDLRVVSIATDGADVILKVDKTQPEVAVVGWHMPVVNGLEITRRITARRTPPAVILLADHPEDGSLVEARRAGAGACLGTESSLATLTAAIRQLAKGGVFCSEESGNVTAAAVKDRHAPPRASLTARERQVLQLIAEGYTTQQMADLLGISKKTADHHRTALMEKLDIHNSVSLTRYAVRHRVIEP
jgi:DNA-binding NarL/FixJ family response regulator